MSVCVKTTVLQQEDKFNYFSSKPFLDKSDAEDIINCFRKAGCEFEEPKPPIKLASPYGNGLSFGVNINPPYPTGAAVLQEALKLAGVQAEWIGFPNIPHGMLVVHIGEKP